MPRKIGELSAIKIRKLNSKGLFSVGGVSGLYINITNTVSKNWILRIKIAGTRRDIGLGGYPSISLSDARNKARVLRDQIQDGIDPIEERRAMVSRVIALQAEQKTFAEVAKMYIGNHSWKWTNSKHTQQWTNTINTYADPIIGNLLVSEIGRHHIMSVLQPIWNTKKETATRLRGRIEKILSFAKVEGWRNGENPAVWKGNLDVSLSSRNKRLEVKHFPSLPYREINDFISQLRECSEISAKCLEFTILTASRPSMTRKAKWSEIDIAHRAWLIPAQKMKARVAFKITLSDDAIRLLNALPRNNNNDIVFPSPRGKILSDATMNALLKRIKINVTVHGFRSTFKNWSMEQTDYSHELSETALAHSIGDATVAAYWRGDLFEKRMQLMEDWAEFINTPYSPSLNKSIK